MMRSTLRVSALVGGLVATLAAPLLGVVPAATARTDGGGAPHRSEATAGVRLSAWQDCTDPFLASYDLQCARLRVPRDYAEPDRGSISLAVTRRLHDPAAGDYQGVLLTSPGGPGSSGTWMPALADYLPQGAGDTYDWIGFDPRGVGASQPALHCVDRYFRTERPRYLVSTRAQLRPWLQRTRNYVRACADNAGPGLLRQLGTRETVRDMESLRQALADETADAGSTLSFYGYSYGSYLGEVYASRYPQHVGRFVLDGVVDPTRPWRRASLHTLARNLERWFDYLAEHPVAFGLGQDAREIRADYRAALRHLRRAPAAGGRLGPDELTDLVLAGARSVDVWERLGHAYAALVRYDNGRPLLREYRALGASGDNGYAVRSAVRCTEGPWPAWSRQLADARRSGSALRWRQLWYDAPCRAWPAPRHRAPAVVDHGVDTPILLVNETQDPITPFSGALRVRHRFGSARLVAGEGGTTHGSSLGGVACVDDAIAAYLRDGTAPPRRPLRGADLTCPGLAPADPTAEAAPRGLPDNLRMRLLGAQRPTH